MLIIKIIQSLDVYFFSLFLLTLISVKALGTPKNKTMQNRTFSVLICLNFLIIIADCASVLLDGKPGPSIHAMLLASMVFGFCFQVLICLFWFWYAHAVVFGERKRSRIQSALQAFPAAVCVVMTVCSCWTGWFFRFDANNFYSRGNLFSLIVGTSFFYLVCGYYMIIRFRKNIDRRVFFALMSFVIPPTVGGIIQTIFYGVTLLWPCMTFSILIIYLAIQNEALRLDYLTGVNNRLNFDSELHRKIAYAKEAKPFALMLINIDNFHSINERYGHIEGDNALIRMAKILETFFHHNGFVARYGGDEFAVIIDIQRMNDLSWIKLQLQNRIDEWNANGGKQWKISVSIGSAPYISADKLSQDHYLLQVNNLLCLDRIVPGERRFRSGHRR